MKMSYSKSKIIAKEKFMLNEIARFIFGYLKIEIIGENRKRLINAAVKTGLRFWNYQFCENKLYIIIHILPPLFYLHLTFFVNNHYELYQL